MFTGMDDDRATGEVLYNSFLVMGLKDLTDRTLAFINFSKALIDTEIPFLLPPSGVVVEVLERGEATQATVEACRRLRERGYRIAMDDFVQEDERSPLFDYADIIKVEYPAVRREDQLRLIKKYGGRKTFLAEKIETREEYTLAVSMGYELFQGYFFSKPSVIGSKEIGSLNVNIFRVMEELNRSEPSFTAIAAHVERDLGLSYKLLKLVNSVYYGPVHKIRTLRHALAHLGVSGLRKWFSIMMLKDMQNVENAEMIKLSLSRAKLMELLAAEYGEEDNVPDCFFTGLFSFIDVLLNRPMRRILDGLPISETIKDALNGEDNPCRRLLDGVVAGEAGDWSRAECQQIIDAVGGARFMRLYMESLKWANRFQD